MIAATVLITSSLVMLLGTLEGKALPRAFLHDRQSGGPAAGEEIGQAALPQSRVPRMVIYLNEDRMYITWVTHHRPGFVLDGRRKPKVGHLVLHRATCPDIKAAASRHSHWTTGARLKACSLDRLELEQWAKDEAGEDPAACSRCQPRSEAAQPGGEAAHLSKLPREVLDYVLDAAVIHFEDDMPAWHLTVGDIAACFGKTPGQISAALHRLIEEGLITIEGNVVKNLALPPKRIVLPTIAAVKTIEGFRKESDAVISSEIAKLAGSPNE